MLSNLDDYQNQTESFVKSQISGLHPDLLMINLKGIQVGNLQVNNVRHELNYRLPSWCLRELLSAGCGSTEVGTNIFGEQKCQK